MTAFGQELLVRLLNCLQTWAFAKELLLLDPLGPLPYR